MGREKRKKSWSIHSVALSARLTYNTAVSTRTVRAQYMSNLETGVLSTHSNTVNITEYIQIDDTLILLKPFNDKQEQF